MSDGASVALWHGRGAFRAAVSTALVAAVVGGAASSATAKVPNVCHITGITRAVAKKVFPKLDSVHNYPTMPTTPPNVGAYCVLQPNIVDHAALDVELWSASDYQQQVTTFTTGEHTKSLTGLGHGAVYAWPKGQKRNGNLLFKVGAYTVLIDTNTFSAPRSDLPTMRQWLKLAHAVHKHLHR